MSGHHGICLRAVGTAQNLPPRAAQHARFAPALSLPSVFVSAQGVAAVFAAAAAHSGTYETRHGLAATFAPAAAL